MTRKTVAKAAAGVVLSTVVAVNVSPAAAGGLSAPSGEAEFRSGELVIEGAPRTLARSYPVLRHYPHSNLTVVAVDPGSEKAALVAARAQGRRAGLNFVVEAFANDPYLPYQWNLSAVEAQAAWEVSDGTGIVVAVLDTGLTQIGAGDGIGCVLPGYNALNGSSNVADGHGHGTHVTGTVAQTTNNATGTAGLAHGACVLPVKVLDDSGSGTMADVAEGIYWAVDNGAQVINMSLGLPASTGTVSDPLVDPALAHALANDVTVVCASGNDGSSSNVSYPAAHSSTVAVGAVDAVNVVAYYSNGGTGLDLVAPGGDNGADQNGDYLPDGILQETYDSGWAYYFYQGTSMASPHVAAAAAMLYANGSASTPAGVLEALTSTAADLGVAGYDGSYGFGLLQVHQALLYSPGGGGPTCDDMDADGWCVSDNDCDDADASVNPGEAEVCGDGVDNNCDGNVDEGCVVNSPPTAASSHSCEDLACSFTDQSSDSDGQVVSWQWDFGDGATSAAQHPSHAYAAEGTYTCTLTVTDDGGASASSSTQVTVTAPQPDPEPGITLTLGQKLRRGKVWVQLYWDGANTSKVIIRKNGQYHRTTRNDGHASDPLASGETGWVTYQICEKGTSNCSNESSIFI